MSAPVTTLGEFLVRAPPPRARTSPRDPQLAVSLIAARCAVLVVVCMFVVLGIFLAFMVGVPASPRCMVASLRSGSVSVVDPLLLSALELTPFVCFAEVCGPAPERGKGAVPPGDLSGSGDEGVLMNLDTAR
jgi:hypothetical protein